MPETINLKFIVIQAVGLIAAGIYSLSYQFKDNKTLFRIQFASFICFSLHFILLGAVTGAVSNLINLVRSYFLGSNNEKLHSKWACAFICLLLVLACIFTWDGPISLLPVIANGAVTIGGFLNSEKKLRLIMIFINAPCWITHDVIVGSWSGALDETIVLIAVIISIFRLGWKNLDKEK